MTILQIVGHYVACFIYIYVLGTLCKRYRDDKTNLQRFVRKNLFLSAIVAALFVITFLLGGGFSFDIFGMITIVTISLIHVNIFMPLIFPGETD